MSDKFKAHHHFGGTIAAGSNVVIFTMYEESDNSANIKQQKLYTAEVSEENKWSNVTKLPFNNDSYSVSQPCLSKDGNTLYFVSDMEGGLGGTDIYVSYRYNNQWTYPINLGAPVNTTGNEMNPFTHGDGTLYFASDAHKGMGGLDIFEAIPNEKGNFSKVANLGYPINTEANDFGLILDDVKRVGFFTSDRKGGRGGNDIYKLNVESISRSRRLTDASDDLFGLMELQLSGTVVIKDKDIPIARAIVKLRNTLDDELQIRRSDQSGEFSFTVKNDAIYELSSTVLGYQAMKNKMVSTIGVTEQRKVTVKLELEPIKYKLKVKGSVINKTSREKLQGIEIVLLNLYEDTQIYATTDDKGFYELELDQDKNYIIFISEKGYQHKEYEISTFNKTSSETQIIDIELLPKE
jgi:hypothetical protein